MLRLISYLFLMIFLITLVRSVIGWIARAVMHATAPAAPPHPRPVPQSSVPLAGELKRDPVCGTYTSAATSLQNRIGDETFYFCSSQCRDKFLARA